MSTHAKADVRCIPRALRDEFALGYHLSLACLRTTSATRFQLGKMGEALMLSNFLLDAGYGRGSIQILADAQNAILAVQVEGTRRGRWDAKADGLWIPMAKLLVLLDRQLSRAPSSQILRAVHRYETATGTPVESIHEDRFLELAA